MAAPLCRAERSPTTSMPYATSSGSSVARFRPYSTKIHATRMLSRRCRFALLCRAPIGSRRRDLRPRPTLRNERTSIRRAASFGAFDSKVARRRVKRGIACFGPTTRKKQPRRVFSSNIARRRRLSRWRGRESGCRLVRRYHCAYLLAAMHCTHGQKLRTASDAREARRARYVHRPIYVCTHGGTRCYYRAGAIKEGSLEISGWRTWVSIESVVVRSSRWYQTREPGMPRRVYVARGSATKWEIDPSTRRDEESPTCLLNMHRPNGTGRGRDKGRLIFPAFHFVPSLFYFGANCYRYRYEDGTFLPLPLRTPFSGVSVKNLRASLGRSLEAVSFRVRLF